MEPSRASQVTIEVNPWYLVNWMPRRLEILPSLRNVREVSVVENMGLPPLCLVVNDRVLGLIDPFDENGIESRADALSTFERVSEFKPSVIFKYQWRRGSEYPAGTVSAGYPCVNEVHPPTDLLTRPRPVDVTARMRVNREYHWGVDANWMIARSQIVGQAVQLQREGYQSKSGFIGADYYLEELWNAQVGFDWRGAGYLTHRLIEYIRAGVVPITRPLGPDWPIREDVVLEDGVHCIFCSEPTEFAREAKLLLSDKTKLQRIRGNLIELWNEKLSPAAQGYWIWGKLKAALTRT